LVSWKKLYLSKGGWIASQTREFFSSLPTYFLSLFPLDVGIANGLEKLQFDVFGVA
jgi:hypothetical protein